MAHALATPPLDGSLLLHRIPDFHLLHNPDHVMYTWKDAQTEEIHTLTHLEFCRAVHRAAKAVNHLDRTQPVGVLALCDTILYHALFLGLMKAGYTPYLMSPRNSPTATVKLLTDVGSCQVFTTPFTLAPLLNEVEQIFHNSGRTLKVVEIPRTDSVFPKLGKETFADHFKPFEPMRDAELSSVAFYLHSSGSTGLPKTIPQTQESILNWCAFQCITDHRLHRPRFRIGATILPSFHTLGIYFQLLSPLTALCVINIAPPICPSPQSLPFTASPSNALGHAKATGCNSICAIPAILEMWAKDADAVTFLKTLRIVWFSGGTLLAAIGNTLTKSGVMLGSVYGATEFGAPAHTVPLVRDISDGDWMYIRFDSRAAIRWVPHGAKLSEAVLLPTEKHKPMVSNVPDGGGYATGDLFERHPSKDLWKVVGRTDDVIVLSSGEKVVPGPAEDIIMSSPLVSICMLIGRERHQVGLIVQPTRPLASDDKSSASEFIHTIRDVIEQANHFNPAFARIFPHMVMVTTTEKPLIRNAKGSLHRKTSLFAFEADIEALYNAGESSPAINNTSHLRPALNRPEISEWLRHQVEELSFMKILPKKDLFEQGLDSVTAAALRHRIISQLRPPATIPIPLDWIYQNPSIDAMSAVLCSSPTAPRPVSIQSMIDKYSSRITPSTRAEPTSTTCNVVLLTGSTGALGSQLLARLIVRTDVDTIYCLNRPGTGGEGLLERHQKTFRTFGIDVTLLQSPKVHLISTNLTDSSLGLAPETIHALRTSAFIIIHNAWRLDFNLTLASFEPMINSTVNLINFGSGCPRFGGFFFMSSVSSAQGWTSKDPVPESVIRDPDVGNGHGYGEGKYVVERLLDLSDINSVSFRISQISGGMPGGAWPTTEWFPILVKSSIAMKKFPMFPATQTLSWVPSDAVACVVLDVAFKSADKKHSVVNVVHPKPVEWDNIANWVVDAIGDPELIKVDSRRWVDELHTVNSAGVVMSDKLPALKLISFFEALTHTDIENNSSGFSVSNTGLLRLSAIGSADVRAWLDYWRSCGFL
ncbi:putative aminoadipate reductase [Mycena pura]|uniref:Aminoadipate reductase n=1 Tax=Mycena pura TaxID=153505 RepID=A0AAD6VE27_9AGAR|nr:putative aminoadipate reductase [Mycena pura]